QVIARKYRPQSFRDLIGQEHVRSTISNAISQRRIAHGYIFAGQRGTGKTTVARILARCLNCIDGPTIDPCGKCASCLEITHGNSPDVIEIDAASNRGINEMRELRESVRYRPARDRYKVFIIDEAHQITSEAFNALLKTLEEPPEWVVFILCTTEAHKIPTTIASRCQQFSFRSVDFPLLVERMKFICAEEGVTADEETLSALAQAGEGSVRDSLSALDQAIACCGEKLESGEVRALLGMFSLDLLGEVARALRESDSRRMLEIVAELEANGRSVQHFCRELARFFRNLLVVKVAGTGTRLIAASPAEQEKLAATASHFSEQDLTRYLHLSLELFKDLQFSLQPRFHLEMGLVRLVEAGKIVPIEEALSRLGGSGAAPAASSPPSPPPATPTRSAAPAPREAPAPAPQPSPPPPPPAVSGDLRARLHAALLENGQTFTADAVEHSTLTERGPNDVVFVTPKEFKLHMRGIEVFVRQVLGRAVRVTVETGSEAGPPLSSPPSAQPAPPAEDEISARALAHPEVQRFQQLFPDAQVRQVRNLKE
ncbi:MAG: DNA polymerase III subunit gamma/tau, partial [Bryobacteraceae bacterium]|nr:DNA polymerase III subunit gamma/tau [Bryobacteraceae bacterium]